MEAGYACTCHSQRIVEPRPPRLIGSPVVANCFTSTNHRAALFVRAGSCDQGVMVTVRKPADVDAATVTAHLGAARGMLRSELATAIHRRKTPDLLFRVVEG